MPLENKPIEEALAELKALAEELKLEIAMPIARHIAKGTAQPDSLEHYLTATELGKKWASDMFILSYKGTPGQQWNQFLIEAGIAYRGSNNKLLPYRDKVTEGKEYIYDLQTLPNGETEHVLRWHADWAKNQKILYLCKMFKLWY